VKNGLLRGSRPVDHTADLALRVWAPNLPGLFEEAALGLSGLITDPARVASIEKHQFELTALDLEELLVTWLGEILYLDETSGLLFSAFDNLQIRFQSDRGLFRLSATGLGEKRDSGRHRRRSAIKAPTYHGLVISPDSEIGYDLTIVFDT